MTTDLQYSLGKKKNTRKAADAGKERKLLKCSIEQHLWKEKLVHDVHYMTLSDFWGGGGRLGG